MIVHKICSMIERNLLNSLHHWKFLIPKKYQSLVFNDNRDLKISKPKKSEKCFREKFEIFICLFDEHFACHFASHWRETWRHIARRTEPPISLETPPPYFCLFSDAEPLRGKISIVKRGKARQEKKIFPETKMKIWSTAKMFFNPFAPEPPVTARADPRPFYPLWRHQF